MRQSAGLKLEKVRWKYIQNIYSILIAEGGGNINFAIIIPYHLGSKAAVRETQGL